MIDASRTPDDSGTAQMADFRAVRGVDFGRKGLGDVVQISAGGPEPAHKAAKISVHVAWPDANVPVLASDVTTGEAASISSIAVGSSRTYICGSLSVSKQISH